MKIIGFIFGAIAGFVFEAINLLYGYSGKYLLQINVRLKEIYAYLDRRYLHCAYLYLYFYYKC